MFLLRVSWIDFTKGLQHPHHNVVIHLHREILCFKVLLLGSYPNVFLAPANEKKALAHLGRSMVMKKKIPKPTYRYV